mgnify:CR=1 FL=1
MVSDIEQERKVLIDILNSEKLEGLPLVWIQSKVAQLINGIPPEKVFLRQQSHNQKNRTKVSQAEIALRIDQLRLAGEKIIRAKELASEEFNVSFDTADTAWRKHGKFLRKDLPREST